MCACLIVCVLVCLVACLLLACCLLVACCRCVCVFVVRCDVVSLIRSPTHSLAGRQFFASPVLRSSPLDHIDRTGPFLCLLLVFVDVLLRVLRLAIFLSATHLQPVIALTFVAGTLVCAFGLLWHFHNARWRWLSARESILSHANVQYARSHIFLHDVINPFLLLLSPWCMFTALACRPYFSAALYVTLGVVDTIGMTAVFAAPLIGYQMSFQCPFDVIGICATDIVPSSCFPSGLAIAFASIWAASVLLWLWAGVVMVVGSRRVHAELAES